MLNSKSTTLAYLYGLQKFGIKLGLRNIELLLESVDHPELSFPAVHIAGTNGKGSTSSMIAAVLTAAGYRVGLYTSPHLVEFNERIRINGRPVSDRTLVRLTNLLKPAIDGCGATFFEATTAIAFRYFAERHVDIAVIETGLGGRLDATNVLTPLVSVITSIGMDHTEVLGSTLALIAREKGGIIKPGVPCVVGRMPVQAKNVLARIARANSSPLIAVQEIAAVLSPDGMLSVHTPGRGYASITLSLKGEYQKDNAVSALAALEQVRSKGFAFSACDVREGLGHVGRLTGLKARLQTVGRKPQMICDVAHNPDAMRVLVDAVRALRKAKVHLIFGVMKDKQYGPMIRTLGKLNPTFYAVEASIARSLPVSALCSAIADEGYAAGEYHSIDAALSAARKAAGDDELILITGSHYIVGEAMTALAKGKQPPRGRRTRDGKKFT